VSERLLSTLATAFAALALGLAAERLAGGLLFGVTPTAADIYLISASGLIATAGLAALPTRRACSIDPSEVLRCE
jgi:glutathione S-transferase